MSVGGFRTSEAPSGSAARWEARALDHVETHAGDIVHMLADLVRVPSVSGSDEENSIQHDLAGLLDTGDLSIDSWQIPLEETLVADGFPGVEVDRREAWGVVASRPGRGAGPSLMFNAHVDVVPPGSADGWQGRSPFDGRLDASSVYGRGACDMKGGLVAALWAMRAMTELDVPLRGDLLLALVQGEEDGGLGTFAMLQRGWRADACVIPEPTSLDLSPGNGGSLTFRLRVHGLATHAARRTAGVSAIEKFWPIYQAVRDLESRRNATRHPLMERWDVPLPIEIGSVTSGDWASSVPDLLVAEGRYGVGLGEDLGTARAAFAEAIADACASDGWLGSHPVDIEWWGGEFAADLTPVDSSVVTTLRAAHESVSTRAPGMWMSPYGSDLRLMTAIGGVPTVHYGPGDAALAHSPGERVPIEEVLTATRALAVMALRHCGVA